MFSMIYANVFNERFEYCPSVFTKQNLYAYNIDKVMWLSPALIIYFIRLRNHFYGTVKPLSFLNQNFYKIPKNPEI